VETEWAAREHHCRGDEAPADHNPRHPAAGADALEDEVARYLEEEVAEEENARPKPVDPVAQVQVALHGQRGGADIYAIQEVTDVHQEEERDEPPRYPPEHRPLLNALD